MRFLFLTQYYWPEVGATQSRLRSVVRELTRLGHECEVVTSLPNYPTGRIFSGYRNRAFVTESVDGVVVRRVWSYPAIGTGFRRAANYGTFSAAALPALLRCRKPEFLIVESPPLNLAVTADIVARLRGVPWILNISDLWPDSIRDLGISNGKWLAGVERLESWAYRKATYLCAVTEGIRSRLITRKAVLEDRVLFLPNGVDTDLYRPLPDDGELRRQFGLVGKRIVLHAGTHSHSHGLENVLAAAASIAAADPSVHFLLVGGGSAKKALMEQAGRMRLPNVTFHDAVPASEMSRLISIAACGLVSVKPAPITEGTRPAKMFGIMGCGKPVLYAGRGEGADLVQHADAGLVVNNDDVEGITRAVLALVRTPGMAERLGNNARQHVEKFFGWNHLVTNWLDQLHLAVTRSCDEARAFAA